MTQIQIRRGNAANWTTVNPVLAAGEFGVELDTLKLKVGDGLTAWNGLTYLVDESADVDSVNGQAGTVLLDTDDIPEGGSLYFTDARARTAAVQDAITNGVTDVAPSQNAVFDALTVKLDGSQLDPDNTLAAASDSLIASQRATKEYVDGQVAAGAAGSVQDAINDGVTGIAPSQNAVFDALTGKSPMGHTHVAADTTDFVVAARTAVVADALVDGVTDVAPSQNVVFDGLAGKSTVGHTHSSLDVTDFTGAAQAAVVVDSIADADTTHAPSRNAVFDALTAKEDIAGKGVAGGYAPLDGSTKVPAAFLPSYVDDVETYANLVAFPVTGESGKIYVTEDTNTVYRWNGSGYTEISASPGSTDAVPEGVTNLYFTDGRARSAVVVDSVADGDMIHAPSRNAVFDALAGKRDVATGTSQVYVRDAGGVETVASYAVIGTGNAIVRRDAAGRAQFVDPFAAQDAATKNYVDTTRVAKSGDTMTGDLTINRDASATSVLVQSDAGQASRVILSTDAVSRWTIQKSTAAESGANAGSDFTIVSSTDAGTFLRNDVVITRSTGNITLGSGILTVGGATQINNALTVARTGIATNLSVQADVGQAARLRLMAGSLERWTVVRDSDTESGADTGSSFRIQSYTDAGVFKANVLSLNRATGEAVFNGQVRATSYDRFASATTAYHWYTNAGGDQALAGRVAADAQERFLVFGSGEIRWGSGAAVADTNLYRASADVLASDDQIRSVRATNVTAFSATVAGDSNIRYSVQADGLITWGPGNAVGDTTLQRTAPTTLVTNSNFTSNRAAGTTAFSTFVPADTVNRWIISTNGQMSWSDGTAAADVSFGRIGANQLRFTDADVQSRRAATTNNAFSTHVTGDTFNRWDVRADGSIRWGSGTAAGDVILYRLAADRLATDDRFSVFAPAASVGLEVSAQGDVSSRFVFRTDGKMEIGSGAVAADVNLYRNAADQLKTDDKFLAVAGIGVGNTTAATTLGAVTRRMEIFDAAGASLGFIPIYNTIT